MLRWLTAGESHGPSLVAILEGMPAHVRVTTEDIAEGVRYAADHDAGGLLRRTGGTPPTCLVLALEVGGGECMVHWMDG